MTKALPSCHKRRWFRFSLRTFFIVFTLLAGVFGVRIHQVQQQSQAVKAIRSMGGTALYSDEGFDPSTWQSGSITWLREIAGIRKPSIVYLTGKTVTDDVLQEFVIPLKSLQSLALDDVSVTDEGLLQLKSFRSLTDLTCIRDQRNRPVLERLSAGINVEFVNEPLFYLLNDLKDLGIPVVADEESLMSAGIDSVGMERSLPVTGRMMRVRLDDGLDSLLGPFGMGWVIREGELVVTTREVAKESRKVVEMLRDALPKLTRPRID